MISQEQLDNFYKEQEPKHGAKILVISAEDSESQDIVDKIRSSNVDAEKFTLQSFVSEQATERVLELKSVIKEYGQVYIIPSKKLKSLNTEEIDILGEALSAIDAHRVIFILGNLESTKYIPVLPGLGVAMSYTDEIASKVGKNIRLCQDISKLPKSLELFKSNPRRS